MQKPERVEVIFEELKGRLGTNFTIKTEIKDAEKEKRKEGENKAKKRGKKSENKALQST